MSAKNKLINKQNRRDDREYRKTCKKFPTVPLPIAHNNCSVEDARTLLLDPKQKLGGPARRFLKSVLSKSVIMPEPESIRLPAVKLAEKLASLKFTQVIRRRAQFARRAASAKYRLEALSPTSRFRATLQVVQDANIHAMKQAQAELDARRLHATGKLQTEPAGSN